MPTQNLLYRTEYQINDYIKIMIPTVGDILDDEDGYYGMVSSIVSMPIDLMVPLDDIGIDFTTINEFELFLLMFTGLKNSDTHLIFGDLELSRFEMAINEDTGMAVLRDPVTGCVIDRGIHGQIASALRTIHHLEKNNRKPANKEAQEYMIERARTKMKRNRSRKVSSQLESLIIAMVNTEQYKYDFKTTRELSIYQFNESVRQVIKKVDYDHKMQGVYAGTINTKNMSQDDFNWLIHK